MFVSAASVVQAESEVRESASIERAASAPLSAAGHSQILQQSHKIKANLELWPERVRAKLDAVKLQLDSLDLKQIESQRLLVGDFEELLDLVDEEAGAIEEAWASVKGEFSLWRDAVSQAPESFQAVASVFEAKAADVDDATLKLHYADFASASRSLAKKYEEKSSAMATQQREIERQMAFVGKSREFIKDVKSFLAAVPATEEGVEVEVFCKRLNAYIKAFQTSVELLKGMATQLGDEKQPHKASSGPDESKAAAKQPLAKPLTPREYQRRLTALRRPR
jgi:hypothetical protein